MTPSEIVQLIGAVSALIAAIGTAIVGVISARNGRALSAVKRQTDGLVEKLGETKLAQGRAEGRAEITPDVPDG
jgi:hypothetical protein